MNNWKRTTQLLHTLQRWFDQLIYPWRVRVALARAERAPTTQAGRKLTEELLTLLQPTRFRFDNYQPDAGQSVMVSVVEYNIESYTKRLLAAVVQVTKEEPITADWAYFPSERVMSIDRFLLSYDGYFLPQAKAVYEFRHAGLRLCQSLQRADNEEFGYYEHNLRVLTKLFVNLRQLTLALVKVSLTK